MIDVDFFRQSHNVSMPTKGNVTYLFATSMNLQPVEADEVGGTFNGARAILLCKDKDPITLWTRRKQEDGNAVNVHVVETSYTLPAPSWCYSKLEVQGEGKVAVVAFRYH